MSELINARATQNFRRQLLATASVAVLLAAACGAQAADDTDRPRVWIELGGQLENMTGQGEAFAPAFIAANKGSAAFGPRTPVDAQKLPYSFGEEGKITYQPEDSHWIFVASVRYGRSAGSAHVAQQTDGHRLLEVAGSPYTYYVTPVFVKFSKVQAEHEQTHAIVDFQAGRDMGLGLFGNGGSSVLGFGVRFAQFTSKAHVEMNAIPNLKTFNIFSYFSNAAPSKYLPEQKFHDYTAVGHSTRSFRGVGPSLSWNGSVPVMGNPQESQIDIDWGINAALLFGRQKASGSHQTTGRYKKYNSNQVLYQHSAPFARSRFVTVPNLGGFAGLSFRYAAAKVSFGYRADFFFGAMDTGIDDRKTGAAGFHGPFASISVGMGG